MAVLEEARATALTIVGRPSSVVVQWNEPLDAVLARMDALEGDKALVMQGDRLVGHISRSDIERLRLHGNWTGCIAAVDAMEREGPARRSARS